MATFDHIIVYEDRDAIQTSRWRLTGLSTKDDGETDGGWLWMAATKSGDDVTISVNDGISLPTTLASGTVDVSTIATAPLKVTLTAVAASGITGEVYLHSWTETVSAVPMCVSLCMDSDIELEYARSEQAHMTDVYDSSIGYAQYCNMASAFILRLVAKLYPNEMGGFGAEEHRNLTAAERLVPRWSRIANPLQLLDAAKFYACWKLCIAADESDGDDSMLAYKAEQFREQYKDAVSAWNILFNTDPDADSDGDVAASASVKRPERV